MRRTTIIATLGPASGDTAVIGDLVAAGVDVVRLNFSHGDNEGHARHARVAREVARAGGRALAVLADLQGPKVRAGRFAGGGVELVAGREVALTTRHVLGDAGTVPCDWPGLPSAVRPGDAILLDDGRIRLEAVRAAGTEVAARVVAGGRLADRKSVNLPGATLGLPSITAKDAADLEFAVRALDVDFVALSFVRSADDVRALKGRLRELGSDAGVVAKIEKPEAIAHIDEIVGALEVGDGIMVARGDLGVETEPARVPALQKRLLRLANECGLVGITATQMLESMVNAPVPTRAETSDVFNAILDGTDAVMLSAETAVGRYPVEAVRLMAEVAAAAETWAAGRGDVRVPVARRDETFELAICRAAAGAAREANARAVVALTRSGRTAALLSKVDLPPETPVFALTTEERTRARAALYFGVRPLLLVGSGAGAGELWDAVDAALLATGELAAGDPVVIASGSRLARGATNVCKVVRLGDRESY
jgi:pyruvate kinase